MRPGIVLGTRGSALALAQARLVETALLRAHPGLIAKTEIFTTSGDNREKSALPKGGLKPEGGVKGLFTKELEEALLGNRIDAAVHSLKDLPGRLPPGLVVAAVLERAPTDDLLISKTPDGLGALRPGAVVGTGSIRRRMQLLRVRPDMNVVEFRGNVPTRLRKLRASERFDAIVLARAGVERLGYRIRDSVLEWEDAEPTDTPLSLENTPLYTEILAGMLPAIGQGAVALEARSDDAAAMALLDAINHRETFQCIRAEREFLRLLDGGCDLPVGARAVLKNGILHMKAILFDDAGAHFAETGGTEPEAVAGELFKMIHAA